MKKLAEHPIVQRRGPAGMQHQPLSFTRGAMSCLAIKFQPYLATKEGGQDSGQKYIQVVENS